MTGSVREAEATMKATSIETAEPWTAKAASAMKASAEPAAMKPRASTVETTAVATAMLGKTGFWHEAERESHCSYRGQPEQEGAGHGSLPPTYLDRSPSVFAAATG
jgi:hypothetical protein